MQDITPDAPPTVGPADAPISEHNNKIIKMASEAIANAPDAVLAAYLRQNFREVIDSPGVPNQAKVQFAAKTHTDITVLMQTGK